MRCWVLLGLLLAPPVWAHGVEHESELLAFSKNGAQALLSTVDHDQREGGSRTTYVVVGGGQSSDFVLDDSLSHGAGRQQHLPPAQCRAALEQMRKALRGFAGIKLHAEGCNNDRRPNLVELAERPPLPFARVGETLAGGSLKLSSDGKQVSLVRGDAVVARFDLVIPADQLRATLSTTGRLLLLLENDEVVGIAESPSGRPEEFVLRR